MGREAGGRDGWPGGAPRFGALNRLFFRLLRLAAFLVIKPYFRLRLEGGRHLPAGPFIVAPNHVSFLDPVVLQSALPRRLVFLMTRSWFDRPALRWFFAAMRCVPVEDEGRNRRALTLGLQALAAGVPVGIFPEGRVQDDGRVGEFSHGVASLSLRAGVPVVPAAILGTRDALPRGRWFPRPVRVTVRLGAPLGGGTFAGNGETARRALLERLTRDLEGEVRRLAALHRAGA